MLPRTFLHTEDLKVNIRIFNKYIRAKYLVLAKAFPQHLIIIPQEAPNNNPVIVINSQNYKGEKL
jgi:hypothetical protein